MTVRSRVGRVLRRLAERVDPDGAPRGGGYSFTFENGIGIVFREDGRGCPLWYLSKADYERAHDEADSMHTTINWQTMTPQLRGGLGQQPDRVNPLHERWLPERILGS